MVKYIITLLLSLFIIYVSYDYGYTVANNKANITLNKQLKEKEEEFVRLQFKYNVYQSEKENEIKNINSKYSSIISSLRNRPERTITVYKDTGTTTDSSRDGSTGEQLFREDAEFLIGEAAKAEVLKQSLINCRRNLIGN